MAGGFFAGTCFADAFFAGAFFAGVFLADAFFVDAFAADAALLAANGQIVPPQIAGIGFGQVTEQPSAIGGAIVCSPVVTATLAADQRVTDSHRGARFLAELGELLQHPESL